MSRQQISALCVALTASCVAWAQTPTPPATQGATERLYEQRGFCAAQRDIAARLRCYEKLNSELFSALAAASKPAAIVAPTPTAPPPPPPKSSLELEAERLALVNKAWGGVFRAFTTIGASIGAGLSYVQYGPLIQAAATELALVEPEARTDAAKSAIAQFEIAIDAYKDAATWWERDISFYSRRDNHLAYAGGLPYSQVGLDNLVGKWSLPTRNSDLLGFHRGVPRAVALQTMWGAASRAAEAGRKLLLDPPATASASDPQARKEDPQPPAPR